MCGQRPARSGLEERCLSWDDCSRPALCAVLAAGWVRLQQVPRAALASLLAWADVLRTNCSRTWEAPPAAERLAPPPLAEGPTDAAVRRASCRWLGCGQAWRRHAQHSSARRRWPRLAGARSPCARTSKRGTRFYPQNKLTKSNPTTSRRDCLQIKSPDSTRRPPFP